MLPAIVSQLVVLLKDTALGFIITYHELLYVAKQIGGRGARSTSRTCHLPHRRGRSTSPPAWPLSLVASWLERRSRRSPAGAPPAEPLPAGEVAVQCRRPHLSPA